MLSFGKLGEKILVGVGLVLVVGLAMGTNSLGNISWDKLKESHLKMVTGRTTEELKMAAQEKLAQEQLAQEEEVGAEDKVTGQTDKEDSQTAMSSETVKGTVKLALYFVAEEGEALKAEQRAVANREGIARAAVEELIAGPQGKGLQGTIPAGTELLDIGIKDGICTVDFSSEFRDNHWGGSSGELLTVYSVVNVLTQFPTVEKVQFLIDGQRVDTLVGHVDLSQPLERNEDIIK